MKAADRSAALLEAFTRAQADLQRANSQVAAAAALYIDGRIDRAEFEQWSTKARKADLAMNAAERAYRLSYAAPIPSVVG